MTDDEAMCANCAYWLMLDDTAGQCRRNAPRPRTVDTGWRWPVTDNDDWCGEWEADEPTCDCDDDETCGICEPSDIDTAFAELVDRLNDNDTPRRRRWWRRAP